MQQLFIDQAICGETTPGHPRRDCWCESGMLVRGVRSLAAVVLRAFLHVYERFTIVGRENLPVDRSFILVANHASHLDTICLLSALPVRQLHRMFPAAASEYFWVNHLRAYFLKLLSTHYHSICRLHTGLV